MHRTWYLTLECPRMLKREDMMGRPTVNSVLETLLLAVMVDHCMVGVESQGKLERMSDRNLIGVLRGEARGVL